MKSTIIYITGMQKFLGKYKHNKYSNLKIVKYIKWSLSQEYKV